MVFQAMVSVMAVNIQFSSPSGVRLSFKRPGILNREGEREKRNEKGGGGGREGGGREREKFVILHAMILASAISTH